MHRNGTVFALVLHLLCLAPSTPGVDAFLCDHYQHWQWSGRRSSYLLLTLSKSDEEQNTAEESVLPTNSISVEEPKRQRRKRYQGKYPRNFKEKYKELEGDESTIQKVLQKGMTPAGTHVPIMLKECLHYMGIKNIRNIDDMDVLQEKSESLDHLHQTPALVVDCTLGYGGHSSHLLEAILERNKMMQDNQKGDIISKENEGLIRISRLIAFDQDDIEIQKTDKRLRETFKLQHNENGEGQNNNNVLTTVHQNFCTLGNYLQTTGETGRVTSLLADLGLSSMQIDDNERGFTYKREGPLDMRMNTQTNKTSTATVAASTSLATSQSTETAYDLLCRLKPKELKSMLEENSDEVYATEIANQLLLKHDPSKKKGKKNAVIPKTTTELADRVRAIVEPLMQAAELDNGKANNSNNKATAAEIKIPKAQLDSTVARVMQAIRIELNGEFRVLEQLLADLPTILAPGGRVVFLTFHSGEDRRVKKAFKTGFKNGIYSSWSRDVVRPTAKERRDNPRSSCCKLRWAVRSDISV